MKISQKLPRFENSPTIFIVSGSFEASFYLASAGQLQLLDEIHLNPREEAKEKQGFINESHGLSLGAVSHKERYLEDLKKRFLREMRATLEEISSKTKISGICLMVPRQDSKKIMGALAERKRKLISTVIFGSYTKKTPVEILEIYKDKMIETSKYILYTPREYDEAKKAKHKSRSIKTKNPH